MNSSVLTAALAAHAAGLSVVPAREDGSKRPEFDTWKEFQSASASVDEIKGWYATGRTGLGVVCGNVSGGLEMLELEGRAVAEGFNERLHDLAGAAGLGDTLRRIEAGYLERTPSGGLHLLYRVPSPHGNTRLASRPATAAELTQNPDQTIKVLMETRGEGGYCIVAPSHGRVHPDGGAWELISGGVDTIVAITDAERDELWRLARLHDQMPEQFPPASASDVGGRPGDRYNDDPDAGQHVLEVLLRHGWTEVFRAGESIYLRRPGKDLGISATLGYVGPGVLRVFTTSTQFEARAHSPFAVYAMLEHGGDFRTAARALASDGTGDRGHRNHRPGSASIGAGESGADGVGELPPPSDPMRVANRLVADRFAADGGCSLVRHWRGAFWDWRTSHWIETEDRALQAIAYRYTEKAVYTKETRNGSELVPWAPTRHKVADLVDALRAVTHLAATIDMPAWLDDREHLPPDQFVSCANGLLHVPTRTVIDHDPSYYNRVAVPFAYDPNPPSPDRWLAFLDELWHDDPDAIAALAEFMGYVISGRLDLHKILLLVGPTRAGKGVIARVLKALVGRGNFAGPTLASLGTNFGLSPLIGKPLAIVSDARLGGANVHQVVERLLSISGEDMLTVDIKYREPWTGTLPTRFLIISNELPRFGDASGAIANRFVVLTLRNSWLGRENPALMNELLGELPGILGWVLAGLDRLNCRGRFAEPSSSTDAIVALADLVSPVSAFVRDRCVVGPGFEVQVDKLYAEWKNWAEDNGHRAGSVQTFARDLRAVLPSLGMKRTRDGDDRRRWYEGVGLHSTLDVQDRGPSRTDGSATRGWVSYGGVVRDGPRPIPMWSEDDDDGPSLTRDTVLATRTTKGDAPTVNSTQTVPCNHYSDHQTRHRRVDEQWVCDACDEIAE